MELFTLSIWISWISLATSAKILMIPANINSHFIYFGQVGAAMANEGDDVTLFLPSNAKPLDMFKNTSLKMEHYPTKGETSLINSDHFSELLIKAALTTSLISWMSVMLEGGPMIEEQMTIDCTHRFEPEVFNRIKAAKYDFIIQDNAAFTCGFVFPYALDVPYGGLSVPYLQSYLYRVPTLPSFSPSITGSRSDVMSFPERVVNMLLEIVAITTLNHTTYFCEKYAPHKPVRTPVELVNNAALWLTLDDLGFNFPGPRMPNFISVGDVMARPAKPLPVDLQAFMDSTNEGVMLVSQGSFMNQLPDDVILKFCKAFKMTPLKVIWKIKDASKCDLDPDKVKVLNWMPQNDILGHHNLKVFFTHGGLNSAIESVYHRKPMIVMPLAIDQPLNAAVIAHRKFGIWLHMADFTAESLVEGIQRILTDQEIQSSIALASEVLKNKPDTPGQRASFWVNHVVKHGHKHLRSGAFELNIFQFYMVDVILFLVVMLKIMLLLLYCSCKYCCRCCLRCCASQVRGKSKEDWGINLG